MEKDSVGPTTGIAMKDKEVEKVRLADAARCEVYVCFEGPLGALLKKELREKIWKDQFMEIFSLLPLEKFNLDRVKPDKSKKEEEERGGIGSFHTRLRTGCKRLRYWLA